MQALTSAGDISKFAVASANSVTANRPANAATGHWLLGVFRFNNSGQTISGSGFAVATAQNTNWTSAVVYRRIADISTEPTSYTFSVASGSARWVGELFLIEGGPTSNLIDVVGTYSPASGTSSTVAPSITLTKTGGLLIDLLVSNISQTGGTGVAFTPPSPMTTIGSALVDTGAVTSQVWAGQQQITSTGATGTRTVAFSPNAGNSQSILIALNPGNLPPTANAGSAQTNLEPGVVVTVGGTDSDPDGTISSIAWTQVSGPTVSLSSSTVASPTFVAPATLNGDTVVLRKTVTDNGGLTGTATVNVGVLPASRITKINGAMTPTYRMVTKL